MHPWVLHNLQYSQSSQSFRQQDQTSQVLLSSQVLMTSQVLMSQVLLTSLAAAAQGTVQLVVVLSGPDSRPGSRTT
jgi:hypothetical protein